MKMTINRGAKHLMLGAATALMAGVPLFSTPSYAEEKSLGIPASMKIFVQDASTAQIASFVQHIWQESPLSQEAEAKLNAARAQSEADSKWLYNPVIEFEGEDKDGADKTKLIGVSQTIDWSGKFLAAGEVAKYELQAAAAERDNARQTIAVNVLSALADYQAAKEILALSSERTKLMERFSELAGKRFKAGDIDQSEFNLAQLAFSEALIQNADAETALGDSKMALESSIGFSVNDMSVLPALSDTLPNIAMSGENVEEVIGNLPAIRMLQARGEALRSAISRARRERIPDPTVSLKGGSSEGDNVIGMSVSIPLNVFNTYGSEVDVAKYKTTAQQKSLQSVFQSAKSRLMSSQRSYELSARAWSVWKKNGARALEQQIDTLDRKFKVGDLSATDYLVQVQQTLDTEIAAKELHSKAWKSWFAWLGASGNIEQWLHEK